MKLKHVVLEAMGPDAPKAALARLLVRMLEPRQGRVYAPCCGSSGMFMHTEARRLDVAIATSLAVLGFGPSTAGDRPC